MYSEPVFFIPSPIGSLKLEFQEKKLYSLSVGEESSKIDEILVAESDKSISKNILLQLKEYFSSAISFEEIPLVAKGSDFQQRVWSELIKIPLGETRTYGEIAKKLNSGPRAVGNACRKNPIQIIIPCHRVVSAKDIGGYAGETDGQQLDIKHWLLSHEGVVL